MARVLVVDDDVSVARLVADVVSYCRHEPIIEFDPLAAAARVRDQRIAAILTDLMMPKLDGVELCAIFFEQRPSVRRVIITAAPHEERVREASREGLVQMVIAKPPSINDIQLALAWL